MPRHIVVFAYPQWEIILARRSWTEPSQSCVISIPGDLALEHVSRVIESWLQAGCRCLCYTLEWLSLGGMRRGFRRNASAGVRISPPTSPPKRQPGSQTFEQRRNTKRGNPLSPRLQTGASGGVHQVAQRACIRVCVSTLPSLSDQHIVHYV